MALMTIEELVNKVNNMDSVEMKWNPRLVRHYTTQKIIRKPIRKGKKSFYTKDHVNDIIKASELKAMGYSLSKASQYIRKSDSSVADDKIGDKNYSINNNDKNNCNYFDNNQSITSMALRNDITENNKNGFHNNHESFKNPELNATDQLRQDALDALNALDYGHNYNNKKQNNEKGENETIQGEVKRDESRTIQKIEQNNNEQDKQDNTNNQNEQKTIILEKGLELHFDQDKFDKALNIVNWFNQNK